jgi:hypothetical protein
MFILPLACLSLLGLRALAFNPINPTKDTSIPDSPSITAPERDDGVNNSKTKHFHSELALCLTLV